MCPTCALPVSFGTKAVEKMAVGSDAVSFFLQNVAPIQDSNCRYHPLILKNTKNVM
jgi:hypothetical protein